MMLRDALMPAAAAMPRIFVAADIFNISC